MVGPSPLYKKQVLVIGNGLQKVVSRRYLLNCSELVSNSKSNCVVMEVACSLWSEC